MAVCLSGLSVWGFKVGEKVCVPARTTVRRDAEELPGRRSSAPDGPVTDTAACPFSLPAHDLPILQLQHTIKWPGMFARDSPPAARNEEANMSGQCGMHES